MHLKNYCCKKMVPQTWEYYRNIQVGSKTGLLNLSRDSEQRETDEFEEAERRMLVEEAKVSLDVF